ncbi:MAG TPA: hypothetical protein VMZ52_18825, partial [Bryobacteraceae bacterium]|nr:hypothetical protein [Bryobacteraceae bacterium]
PRFGAAPAVVRAVAGSWQINGLLTMRTGLPFNVVSGRDIALSGTPNQRPDVVADPRLPEDRSKNDKVLAWFNRSAFAFPAAGTYGNTGRNALIGPGAMNANLGLFKNIPLPGRENLRLQFRSEFFNVLNHANFGNPNTQLSAGANMGRITSAAEARVIQFALKLLF